MSFGTLSCHLLLLTQFLALAHQDLLGFLSFLSFGFESSFLAFPKMSEDKKAVTVMMWKVAGKTPKIDPGGQAMQFLENQPLNKVILSI
jgi:hypothetical protein